MILLSFLIETKCLKQMNERRPQTSRNFQCRDHLWRLFQFVADDLGCTVDYLINESMREYARGRGYSITEAIKLSALNGDDESQAEESESYESVIINPLEPLVYPERLFVVLDGSAHEIQGDSFVIGRGSRVSDLTISDANVSRRHCIVERKGDEYVISDLGSTNGIEVGGVRVESHRIEHNLSVYLCDYELRFVFRD